MSYQHTRFAEQTEHVCLVARAQELNTDIGHLQKRRTDRRGTTRVKNHSYPIRDKVGSGQVALDIWLISFKSEPHVILTNQPIQQTATKEFYRGTARSR